MSTAAMEMPALNTLCPAPAATLCSSPANTATSAAQNAGRDARSNPGAPSRDALGRGQHDADDKPGLEDLPEYDDEAREHGWFPLPFNGGRRCYP